MTVSPRLQHENYSIFDEESVQEIICPFYCLNLPSITGAPNAIHRHASLDLPSRVILIRTMMSTVCPFDSYFTFILKLF
jgi:hypothetical protein